MSALRLPTGEASARLARTGHRDTGLRRGADALMVILLLTAAYVYLHEMRSTTFSADEWLWIMSRRGSSLATFLRPHNGHLSLLPIVIYKVLWAIWGLRTYVPNRLVVVGLHLVCGGLVYLFARRRLAPELAPVPAALVLFFGAGAQNVISPFQMTWLISIDCGLAALLLLDRRTRRADLTMCGLLAGSLASSGLGLGIAVGTAIGIIAAGGARRRWWIFGGPLAAYVVWWIAYQNVGATQGGLLVAPGFMWRTTAAAASGLVGLWEPGNPSSGLAFGAPLLMAVVVIAGVRLSRALHPQALALIVALVVVAASIAVNRDQLGTGYDARYLYVLGVLLAVFVVELCGPASVPLVSAIGIGAIAVAAVLSGVSLIQFHGGNERFDAVLTRADLAAIDIGRPVVRPHYLAVAFPQRLIPLDAQEYLAAARSFGTPADHPAEVPHLSGYLRALVDRELIGIHAPALTPSLGVVGSSPAPPLLLTSGRAVAGHTDCETIVGRRSGAGAGTETVVRLPAHGMVISARGGAASVGLIRFADTFQPIGTVSSGAVDRLVLAPDDSPVPWRVSIATAGATSLCGLP